MTEPWEKLVSEQTRREERRKKSRAEVHAIFALAGFEVKRVWELANGYWPDHPDYDEVRTPWWLVDTDIGLVQIGWRKRVLSIDWGDWGSCEVRALVTKDDVTKGDGMVHAWTTEKAVEYLRELRRLAQLPKEPEPFRIGDVVRNKVTDRVCKVARFAHDGTSDFWADNETGPYRQVDFERIGTVGDKMGKHP